MKYALNGEEMTILRVLWERTLWINSRNMKKADARKAAGGKNSHIYIYMDKDK